MAWKQWKYLEWLAASGKLAALTAREARVLMVLIAHAIKTDMARPSRETIARQSGVNARKLTAVLARLHKPHGLITIAQSAGGTRNTTRYRLEMPPACGTLPLFSIDGDADRTVPHGGDSSKSRTVPILGRKQSPRGVTVGVFEQSPFWDANSHPRGGQEVVGDKNACMLSGVDAERLARKAGVDPAYIELLVRNVNHLQSQGKLRRGWRHYLEAGIRAALEGKPYALRATLAEQDEAAGRREQARVIELAWERHRLAVATGWFEALPAEDQTRLLIEARAVHAKRRESFPENGAAPYHVFALVAVEAIGRRADKESLIPHYDDWSITREQFAQRMSEKSFTRKDG